MDLSYRPAQPERAPVAAVATEAPELDSPELDGLDAPEEARAASAAAPVAGAELRRLLADSASAPDAVLAALYTLQREQPAEAAKVAADRALLTAALTRLGAGLAAQGLLALQFGGMEGRSLATGGELLLASGTLSVDAWMRLVAGRGSAANLGVLASPTLLAALQKLDADPMNLLPGLSMDPAALGQALESSPALEAWITARGGAARLKQVTDTVVTYEAAAASRADMVKKGTWTRYLQALPAGPITDATMQRKLYNYLLASEDGARSEWATLFEKRFGYKLATDAGARWDKASAIRVWQIADLTPGAHVEDIVRFIRESEEGEASGWAGGGEIGMTWGTSEMGLTEIGAYTSDSDPMRGLNIFDATVRHEIGHIVGESAGYDQPGGFVYSQFGWDTHTDFATLLEDTFLPQYPLVLSGVPNADRLRGQIVAALGGVTTFNESAYRAAVERVQPGLWRTIAAEPLIGFLVSRTRGGAWNSPSAIDGRSYHVAYDWYGWCSAPTTAYSKKPSDYAMRSPMEWFAEAYATFYAEADQPGRPLGRLLAARDPALSQRFLQTVHPGNNLSVVTGQGSVGVPDAKATKKPKKPKLRGSPAPTPSSKPTQTGASAS